MVKSVFYTCRDVTREPGEGEELTIVGVHVCTSDYASFSMNAKQMLTHLAVQYLGTETAPLYLLHWFPAESKLDLTFGDVGTPAQVEALGEIAATQGAAPFLKACGASFEDRCVDSTLQCSIADIEYESMDALVEGKHTVALGINVTVDRTKQMELNSLLSLCARQ